MSTSVSTKKNAAEIARETFKQMSASRTPPTPQAYKKFYNEIAGIVDEADIKTTPFVNDMLVRTLGYALPSLLTSAPELSKEAEALSILLKKSNAKTDVARIESRLKDLCFKIENLPVHTQPAALKNEGIGTLIDDELVSLCAKLLAQTLTMAVGTLLQHEKTLLATTETLATKAKDAHTITDFVQIEPRLKDLCFKIALKAGDDFEQHELLLSLFKLLLENVSSLMDNDNWLRGQVDVIRELISGELDYRGLLEASRGLKEVIYKQGVLKESINQSNGSIKNLMNMFVDKLDTFTNTTGWYHDRITGYSHDVSQENFGEVVHQFLEDTSHVQSETKEAHELMLAAQKEVAEAQAAIKELEKKLVFMSEQVQRDQLTGSLNRRGFDEVLAHEAARADRGHKQLCLSMLDIDDFKKINDTYGHTSGDDALIHLVSVIKQTLRGIDIVARYGGEEFAIIMPETSLHNAADTMIRLQRELTKYFFMAGNERVVITFSAGVAERHISEDLESLIKRADKAMYQAKDEGKNRVVAAQL